MVYARLTDSQLELCITGFQKYMRDELEFGSDAYVTALDILSEMWSELDARTSV